MLRTNVEISWNKTSFFPSAGRGFTTLLRLGLGLCLPLQACPQVGLVSAFCACPPTFALDFLHPRPRGRKLVLNFWVPSNWPRGDLHSRADVMSSVQRKPSDRIVTGFVAATLKFRLVFQSASITFLGRITAAATTFFGQTNIVFSTFIG